MKLNTTHISPLKNYKIEKKYKAMGGEFHLMCFAQNNLNQEEVYALFDRAYAEVVRIEKKMTDFKPSDFNRINELAGIRPCRVDPEIYNLIERSILISQESEGLFDISYASIGHKWREEKIKGNTLSLEQRTALLSWVDYTKIQLDLKGHTIYLPSVDMKIGLGGIGKGYAVDCAYEILKSNGLYNFYINGSGDIRVNSHPTAPRAWRVGIKNPFRSDPNGAAGLIQMSTGSIATSGGYIQNLSLKDHHILNPITGQSEHEIISATILADNCILADTTATIVINKSSSEAIQFLDSKKMIGILIDSKGVTHLSRRALDHFNKAVT